MSWMDNYRQSREDGTYLSDGFRYRNNAIDEIVKQNYKKWMHKDELKGVLKDIAELLSESDVLNHDDISSLEYAREDILDRLENLDNEGKKMTLDNYNLYAGDERAALLDAIDENYKTWWDKKELEKRYDMLNELIKRSSSTDLNMSDDEVKRANKILSNITNQLQGAFEPPEKDTWGVVKSNPTGIHNPADYLPAMRVGDAYEKQTVYEDIDGDGDTDKVTIEEKA